MCCDKSDGLIKKKKFLLPVFFFRGIYQSNLKEKGTLEEDTVFSKIQVLWSVIIKMSVLEVTTNCYANYQFVVVVFLIKWNIIDLTVPEWSFLPSLLTWNDLGYKIGSTENKIIFKIN